MDDLAAELRRRAVGLGDPGTGTGDSLRELLERAKRHIDRQRLALVRDHKRLTVLRAALRQARIAMMGTRTGSDVGGEMEDAIVACEHALAFDPGSPAKPPTSGDG